mmetsp:Transcript_30424/g.68623  ORF Transcript_30424/g.68623 Transcript_30424/m.68623 type:complete len:88 (+) Transcript_30424:911-1174(+)
MGETQRPANACGVLVSKTLHDNKFSDVSGVLVWDNCTADILGCPHSWRNGLPRRPIVPFSEGRPSTQLFNVLVLDISSQREGGIGSG